MKSFARISEACLGVILALMFVFALSGCQSVPETPRVATPTLSVVSSSAFTPTSAPTKSPTSTATAIPSLAFAPALTATPVLVGDKSPTSARPAVLLDGVLAGLPQITRVAPNPQPVTSSTPKLMPVQTAPHLFKDADLFVHLPPQADQNQPLRVLLVLHGMGGNGNAFAQSLVPEADANHWVVVAPTMPYQDYMQTALLMDDDLKISQMVLDTLNMLPGRLHLNLKQHILIYGFSRGAQLAHRFALLHPERVGTVATISAGSYTLPLEHAKTDDPNPLPFPFGVGDLAKHLGHPLDSADFNQISFWIAVGERDNQQGDVPRSFDPYIGQTRIDRARAFANVLLSLGIDTRLVIFPNTGHEVTTEMRKGALQFLREDELKDNLN